MTKFYEREAELSCIVQDTGVKKIKQLLAEGFDLEIDIKPERNNSSFIENFLENVEIVVYDNKEKNFGDRIEKAHRFSITFIKLLVLYENGDLPDYLYNLAMERVVETPSETALKFMEILNKKQTK